MDLEDRFRGRWPPTTEQLRELLDDICTDAYGDAEQATALLTAFDDHAELPVYVEHAGETVRFEGIEDRDVVLLARIRPPQGKRRRSVPLEDLRARPGSPAAFLIASWRLWRGMTPFADRPVAEGTRSSRPDLAERLRGVDRAALEALVLELSSTSAENAAVVDRALGLVEPASGDAALLAMTREKIERWVAPGPDAAFQLEAAVDAIAHYAARTDDEAGEAALWVHFLESGVTASRVYGDLFSGFHDAMAEAAARCGDLLDGDEELTRRFLPALEGLGDGVDPQWEEAYAELIGRLDELEDEI